MAERPPYAVSSPVPESSDVLAVGNVEPSRRILPKSKRTRRKTWLAEPLYPLVSIASTAKTLERARHPGDALGRFGAMGAAPAHVQIRILCEKSQLPR